MRKNKVLIIDDVKIVCVAIRMALADKGYECDIALDHVTALEMIKLKKYDIVFIDLLMDDINGVELCKIIKKELAVGIMILMTGYIGTDLEEILRNFVKAGGNASYLLKPFEIRDILTAIDNSLLAKGRKA
ncbi:MAG: response regulator [Candidatus Omnitrophica bacterium]|nr:response regulator [Candidatus Omnitrophota bacterium]